MKAFNKMKKYKGIKLRSLNINYKVVAKNNGHTLVFNVKFNHKKFLKRDVRVKAIFKMVNDMSNFKNVNKIYINSEEFTRRL